MCVCSDKFREFVEQMSRMTVPGDHDEEMQKRVTEAREEGGADPIEDYVLAAAKRHGTA